MMKRFIPLIALILTIILLNACLPSQIPPTANPTQQFQTAVAIVKAATAQASTPTATSTSTPIPTWTTIPTVRPTPTGTPAGKGNITGRLVYRLSGKPAQGYSVGLGTGYLLFEPYAWTESNEDGYYAFLNVPAQEWIVAVDDDLEAGPLSPWTEVKVFEGITKTVDLEVIDRDLKLVSPPNRSVQKIRRPILRWTAYPGADAYKVTLQHEAYEVQNIILPLDASGYITRTEISPLRDLAPGWYYWSVTALYSRLTGEYDTWAYCDCGGETRWDNHWKFGIPGDKTLMTWLFEPSGPFGKAEPALWIYNQTYSELTLLLMGYGTIVMNLNEEKKIDLLPGIYPYTATVPDLPPISGTVTIKQGQGYTWRLYVSSSIPE